MITRLRAQSTVEYMVGVVIIIGAFLAMQQYIKRGFQGRWKTSVDDFGEQYDPRLVNSIATSKTTADAKSVVTAVPGMDTEGNAGFYTDRVDTSHSVETKNGESTIGSIKE